MFDDEDEIPVVVNVVDVLQVVHRVTMHDEATQADKDMADSLLSGILPELRYPTTALRPDMKDTWDTMREKYGEPRTVPRRVRRMA